MGAQLYWKGPGKCTIPGSTSVGAALIASDCTSLNSVVGESPLEYEFLIDQDMHAREEYRWWVTETVPGDLVQYEFEDMEDGDHCGVR